MVSWKGKWSEYKLLKQLCHLPYKVATYVGLYDRFEVSTAVFIEVSGTRRYVDWETATFRNNLLPPYIESKQSEKSVVPDNLFKLGSILLRTVGKYPYPRRFELSNVLYISVWNMKLQHRPAICTSHRAFMNLINMFKWEAEAYDR
jgi:hypothetical protein